MINVTVQDIDAACAAYRRATGDNPRREGIRVALHSYRQLSDEERASLEEILEGVNPGNAKYIKRLLGLSHE